MPSSVSHVKRAQKESLLLREISQLLMQTSMDDTRLQGLTITRVQLSPHKGACTIYLYTPLGEEKYKELEKVVLLYKPSLRKALATSIPGRYTPELIFAFDKQFEKVQRLEGLMEQVKSQNS